MNAPLARQWTLPRTDALVPVVLRRRVIYYCAEYICVYAIFFADRWIEMYAT